MMWTVGDEIAHAEDTLADALRELEERLTLGRQDKDTNDLIGHCAEMLEILEDVLRQAGRAAGADDARTRAAVLAARLARLQHDFGRVRLQ